MSQRVPSSSYYFFVVFCRSSFLQLPFPLYAPTHSLQDHSTPAISKKLLRIHPELWLWSHFLPCLIKYLHALVLCSSSPSLMETGGSLWNSLGKWLLICHQIPLSLFFLCSLRYKKIRLCLVLPLLSAKTLTLLTSNPGGDLLIYSLKHPCFDIF